MINPKLRALLDIERKCIDEEDPTSWKQPFGTRYFRDHKELTLLELLDFYEQFRFQVDLAHTKGELDHKDDSEITSFGECLDWACGHPLTFETIRAFLARGDARQSMLAGLSLREALHYVLVHRAKPRTMLPGRADVLEPIDDKHRGEWVASAFAHYLAESAGIKLKGEHFLITPNHIVINIPIEAIGLKEEDAATPQNTPSP